MKGSVGIGTAVVVVLLVLGSPFLHIKFGLPDDRVLPKSAVGRTVQDQIRAGFSSQEASAVAVVAPDAAIDPPTLDTYAARLSSLPGAARVDALTGSFFRGQKVFGATPASARFSAPKGTWLSVVPAVEPMSGAAEHLVKQVRATPAPFPILVSGQSAQLVDAKHSIF